MKHAKTGYHTCNNMVPHCQRGVIFRRNFSFMHPGSKSCCIRLDYLIEQLSQWNDTLPITCHRRLQFCKFHRPKRATVHEADLECIYPLTFRFAPKLTVYPFTVDMKHLRLQLSFPAGQWSRDRYRSKPHAVSVGNTLYCTPFSTYY